MSLVSIIIPVYNRGEFLEEAVQSALRQTHKDVELIIVNDGSTDLSTNNILAQARWPRTRILHQENKGPAAARNKGIEHANGEYLLPLDGDDVIDPTYVEKALAAMKDRPNIGIVYCKAMRFGMASGPWELPPFALREMVIDNVIFCTGLFRKAHWKLVGGYTESLRHGMEDYDFWLKLLGIGLEVTQLDEYLFHYRVNQVSRTSQFGKSDAVVVATYADIFRRNADFFAKHAEVLFEQRFQSTRRIQELESKLSRIGAIAGRFPKLKKVAQKLFTLIESPAFKRLGRSP